MDGVTVDIKRLHQIENARILLHWKGARAAADYLRKLGWSIEAALWILLGLDSE